MKLKDKKIILSPSDLTQYSGCEYSTYLSLQKLKGYQIDETIQDDFNKIIVKKGLEHELNYLNFLKTSKIKITEIDDSLSPDKKSQKTSEALAKRDPIIFQAALEYGHWSGIADFLIWEKTGYTIVDTKLKKNPSPEYISQIIIYASILENLNIPLTGLGRIISPSTEQSDEFNTFEFKISEFSQYVKLRKEAIEDYISNNQPSYPAPCSYCDLCNFSGFCKTQWRENLSIFELPYATKLQEKRLREVGANSLEKLTKLEKKPEKMAPHTFEKLKARASLRLPRLKGGTPEFKYLGPEIITFENAILPKPNNKDIYFDIEGDPLIDSGLEYLFGVLNGPDETALFEDIWAHNPEGEKKATQKVIRKLHEHCVSFPNAHIYHYNAYEINALRKLSQKYSILEDELDALLRADKFVDLYPIVQQAIITSEPGVSLKDLEIFFLKGSRAQEITNAASSVVMYEKWLELAEPRILDEIKLYNEQDCRSLPLLQMWLINEVYPQNISFKEPKRLGDISSEVNEPNLDQEIETYLALQNYFKRDQKPYWWSYFDSYQADIEDLVLDSSILAGLSENHEEDESFSFTFPEQEHKFSKGNNVTIIIPPSFHNKMHAAKIEQLDNEEKYLTLRTNAPISGVKMFHLKGTPPPPTKQIENLIKTISLSAKDKKQHKTSFNLLEKVQEDLAENNWVEHIIDHPLINKNNSVIYVQGPPGSGKTYQGGRFLGNFNTLPDNSLAIVTSQSHKAIEKLLLEAYRQRQTENMIFIKYGGSAILEEKNIQHLNDYNSLALAIREAKASFTPLILGITIYGIAKLANEYFSCDDCLADYLLIDEAGQYSTAAAFAASGVSKHTILLGDQNQLPNVSPGSHPLGTGNSIMQYTLGSDSIVPASNGLFLPTTRRLHPNICKYISDKFYKSKLVSHETCSDRKLVSISDDTKQDLSGIYLRKIQHEGCTQSSNEEVEEIQKLIDTLKEHYALKIGETTRNIEDEDFIIIAPYNAQVKLLQSKLNDAIKVGTVDRFQGQEAPFAIYSMAASTAEDAPKGINFLLDKNRLNVAISRAQICSIVVCSKYLFNTKCNTIEQMKLLDIFASLENYNVSHVI
jgi:uncharacterized protein